MCSYNELASIVNNAIATQIMGWVKIFPEAHSKYFVHSDYGRVPLWASETIGLYDTPVYGNLYPTGLYVHDFKYTINKAVFNPFEDHKNLKAVFHKIRQLELRGEYDIKKFLSSIIGYYRPANIRNDCKFPSDHLLAFWLVTVDPRYGACAILDAIDYTLPVGYKKWLTMYNS